MLSRKRIQRSVTTATTTTRTSRTTTDEGKATTEAVVEAVLHSMLSWHNLQSHKHTQNHASCGSSSQQKQQATCGPKKYATHAVGLSVCPFNYALMYSLSLSLSSCLFLSLPLLPPHSSCHSLYVLLLTPRLLAQGQVQASNPPKNEENQQQKITKKKGTAETANDLGKCATQKLLPHPMSLPFLPWPSLVNPYAALCQHIFGEQQQRLTVTFSGASNVPFACHLPHAACHLPSPDCFPACLWKRFIFECRHDFSWYFSAFIVFGVLWFLWTPKHKTDCQSCLSVCLSLYVVCLFCVRQLVELL